MSLPSDTNRKIQNIVQVGKIVAVDLTKAPGLVRVEINKGVFTGWMPVAMPFIGKTRFWCAPKIGVSGTVFNEGGEDTVCRFRPDYYDESNYPYLTDADFKIIFDNDDEIHHQSENGELTINVTNKTTVNVKEAIVNATTADVNAPDITLNGDVVITQSLTVWGHSSLNGGFAMNGGSARSFGPVVGIINLPVIVNNVMTYNIDPVLHGTPYLGHKHKGVLIGGATTEGVDQ